MAGKKVLDRGDGLSTIVYWKGVQALVSWQKSQYYFKNKQNAGRAIQNNFAAVTISTLGYTFSRKKWLFINQGFDKRCNNSNLKDSHLTLAL